MAGITAVGAYVKLRAASSETKWLSMTAVLVALIGIGSLLPAHGQAKGTVADLILTNGKVYTVNPAQPWAEAVAVKDGKIIAVGTTKTL